MVIIFRFVSTCQSSEFWSALGGGGGGGVMYCSQNHVFQLQVMLYTNNDHCATFL